MDEKPNAWDDLTEAMERYYTWYFTEESFNADDVRILSRIQRFRREGDPPVLLDVVFEYDDFIYHVIANAERKMVQIHRYSEEHQTSIDISSQR